MSQILKKGIGNDQVDGNKILILNNQAIKARNAADSANVNLLKLNASDVFEFLQVPQYAGSPFATMADVQTSQEGLLPKDPVRLATTAVLPDCTYDNGASGVGATLTGDLPGALADQDGVSPLAGDSILVKDQADSSENGIYEVTDLGDVLNPFILTRRSDFDNSVAGEVRVGARTFVYDGTLSTGNKFKSFVVTNPGTIVIGTDDIDFGMYSSSEGSPVLSVNGNVGAVVLDTDDIAEGSNLYYTLARFNTAFSGKTTTDLSEGSNLYYTNARGIGSLLTGYTSGAGTVASTDSILQAIQKLNGNIALKQDASTAVTSVNGVSPVAGAVTIDSDDVDEGSTNLYFTDLRAKTAAVANAIVDGVNDVAPSQNAVFDALALKQASLTVGFENLTLNGTDITNQYKDLAQIVAPGTLRVQCFGVLQRNGVDYTLSTVASKTRITFAGDLATGGNAALVSGDAIYAEYSY